MPSGSDQKAGEVAGGAGADDADDGLGRRITRPRALMRLPGWSEAAMSTGKVAAALSSSTPPAWMPPTSGSTIRSTTGRPSRSPTMRPTERSPKVMPVRRWGLTRSFATPIDSTGLRIPDLKRGHHLVGTPRFSPSGIMRRRPRAQIDAPDAPTGTSVSSRPSSAHRSVASGRRARKPSAARSTLRPANSAVRILPPVLSDASKTCTSGPESPPAPAVTSSQAAASPAMPPPTTATTGRGPGELLMKATGRRPRAVAHRRLRPARRRRSGARTRGRR